MLRRSWYCSKIPEELTPCIFSSKYIKIFLWMGFDSIFFQLCAEKNFFESRFVKRGKLKQSSSVFLVILSVLTFSLFLLTRCNNLPKMFSQWKFCKLVNKFPTLKVEAASHEIAVLRGFEGPRIVFEEHNWACRQLKSRLKSCNWSLTVLTKTQLSHKSSSFQWAAKISNQKMKSLVKEESHSWIHLRSGKP